MVSVLLRDQIFICKIFFYIIAIFSVLLSILTSKSNSGRGS